MMERQRSFESGLTSHALSPLQNVDKFSSYPVYHTIYETFELVEHFYDPTFRKQLAVARLRGSLVYELADSPIIPFNCQDYGDALQSYASGIYNLAKRHKAQLETYGVSFGEQYAKLPGYCCSFWETELRW